MHFEANRTYYVNMKLCDLLSSGRRERESNWRHMLGKKDEVEAIDWRMSHRDRLRAEPLPTASISALACDRLIAIQPRWWSAFRRHEHFPDEFKNKRTTSPKMSTDSNSSNGWAHWLPRRPIRTAISVISQTINRLLKCHLISWFR